MRRAGFDTSICGLFPPADATVKSYETLIRAVHLNRLEAIPPYKTRIFMTLGIKGTPKILIIFLGVPAKFLKKVGVFPGAAKGFCLRREAAPAGRRF